MRPLAALLMGATLIAVGTAFAAEDTPTPRMSDGAPQAAPAAMDEALIQGKSLRELRLEIYKAEDRFYALYNQVNTKHLYDIHCTVSATTGTRLEARVCTPVFVDRATEDEGRGFVQGHYAPPAFQVVAVTSDYYRQNARQLVAKYPQLLDLLRERYEAAQRYQRILKQRTAEHTIQLD